jgi:hypothetical protein
MKWWAISGSWRLTNAEVERDVRDAVRSVINKGDGIVSGGALNVDYFATDEALTLCPSGTQIKIIIPTPLNVFAAHFRTRAGEGVITNEQAEVLIAQLTKVKAAGSLIEMNHAVCNQETYYDRNSAVIDAADCLLAFHVNGSGGVQDAVDKARARGMEVVLKSYNL